MHLLTVRSVFLFWLLLSAIFIGTASAQAGESRYRRTIDALQLADEGLQARFAELAILELTEIYIAEADLARNEAEAGDGAAKLRAWSRAVDQYAAQLALVLEDIEFGLPVELRNNDREVSSVTVGGRTVLLAHARVNQQAAYERSVLTAFCTGSICTDLTAELEGHEPIPVSAGTVVPAWDFSAEGPVCSYRGIAVHFGSGGELGRQRSLCLQLLQELEALAAELAWQQRHGVTVDWENLSTRPTPGQPGHLIQLNSEGDALLLTVPLVNGTPGLLQQLVPWLQQRHLKESPVSLSLDAEQLGWS